eukprot:scaffold14745_cov70-Cyclotella_meneghiniana.AAC.1
MPAAAERESYIAASCPTFNGVIRVHRPINLMMCMVANLTYILLSSDGADTNNNDECASRTVADGSSTRARENEYVALLNHGRTNEMNG